MKAAAIAAYGGKHRRGIGMAAAAKISKNQAGALSGENGAKKAIEKKRVAGAIMRFLG